MHDEITDGSSAAFPTSNVYAPDGEMEHGRYGINIRDYFAAKALAALVSISMAAPLDELAVAREAYKFADAMVKARAAKHD